MDSFKEILAQAKKDKNKKKTDTGEKPDEVMVNPVKDDRKDRVNESNLTEISSTLATRYHSRAAWQRLMNTVKNPEKAAKRKAGMKSAEARGADKGPDRAERDKMRAQRNESLDEAVVTLSARIKRAQNMRKYRSRLQRGKKLAQAKMATNSKLRAKTQNLARRVVKKQVTGARGWEYQNLSPADKIAIDKMVDRKLVAVKRVAARLAPKVRQAEVKRYASRSSGKGTRGTLSYVK